MRHHLSQVGEDEHAVSEKSLVNGDGIKGEMARILQQIERNMREKIRVLRQE